MGNGIQFMGDGPVMTGTWYNPSTGHKFTVRDCFFQDGQFIVQTTDGQMLDYNTVQDYVQASDAAGLAEMEAATKAQKAQNPLNDIPQSILDEVDTASAVSDDSYLLPEDQAMISGHQTAASTASKMVSPTRYEPDERFLQVKEDPDMPMVERVLRRFNDITPTILIDYNKLPKKQLDTLVDVLGIAPQTIAEYYIKKLDVSKVFEELKASIVEAVEKCLYAEVYEAQRIQKDIEDAWKEGQKIIEGRGDWNPNMPWHGIVPPGGDPGVISSDPGISIQPDGSVIHDCVLRQAPDNVNPISVTYPPEPIKTKKKSGGKKTTKKNASK